MSILFVFCLRYACMTSVLFEYNLWSALFLYPSICVHCSITVNMWRKQTAMVTSLDCLRYCAYILCSCMGFVPPKIEPIPAGQGRYVLETLARQVWHLQNLGLHINLRLYYELIPVENHVYARPEGFTLMSEIRYEQKTCLICVSKIEMRFWKLLL